MSALKRCSACRLWKECTLFESDSSRKDKHNHRCRNCLYKIRKKRGYNTYAKRREKLARYRAKNKEKITARATVQTAVRSGKLAKEPCYICKTKIAQAHHHDYSKPLDVVWLCKPCHNKEHKQQSPCPPPPAKK